MKPPLAEVLAHAHVLSLPMRVRFRGIERREVLLLRGPAGWGEFAPFPEYDDAESAWWLASAIEAAWQGPPEPVRQVVPVNATVPAVEAARVPELLARFPGATTAKVKVAEKGQRLADDVARVEAVRTLIPNVRVDANGGWSVAEALQAVAVLGPLEYAEQPCRTVEELVALRSQAPGVLIAADESIRRAEDPMRVVRAGGADVAVVKVAPIGGMRRLLHLADELAAFNVPVVVSSALDSAVGISTGLAAAAALPNLPMACGLGTGGLLADDVAAPPQWVDGHLPVGPVEPNPAALARLAAPADRARWWVDRLSRCWALLPH